MNPGLFRNRITFLKSETTVDDIGQQISQWVEHKGAWAMIKTVKGTEYFEAAAVQGERTYRFVIRYTTDISSDMRIDFKGRVFDIIEPPINDNELNKTLTIIAKERV